MRYHVSRSPGPRLPTEEGSSAVMCPAAPDLASLLRKAPVLSCVMLPQTSLPCRGGLQCCHMSYGFGPHLPTEMGSGVAVRPVAPNPDFLLRRAPTLPHVPQLSMSHGPQG
jgi:hypothetical protein